MPFARRMFNFSLPVTLWVPALYQQEAWRCCGRRFLAWGTFSVHRSKQLHCISVISCVKSYLRQKAPWTEKIIHVKTSVSFRLDSAWCLFPKKENRVCPVNQKPGRPISQQCLSHPTSWHLLFDYICSNVWLCLFWNSPTISQLIPNKMYLLKSPALCL